jgi:hypothetical protein
MFCIGTALGRGTLRGEVRLYFPCMGNLEDSESGLVF